MNEWGIGIAKPRSDTAAWGSPFTILEDGWRSVSLGLAFQEADGCLRDLGSIDWGSSAWSDMREDFGRMWMALGRSASELGFMTAGKEHTLVFIEDC